MKPIFLSVLLQVFLIFFVSCVKDSPTQPTDNVTETRELKDCVNNIIATLKNNDAEGFLTFFSENTAKYYSNVIKENKGKLSGFAEILENRKLIAYDGLYAVYEVTYNGKTFEITMYLDESGKWKLRDF